MRNFRGNHNKYLILLDISPYLCHIPAIKFLAGGDMGYKQIEPNMTFAEASLMSSMEHNRSLKRLEKINQVIDWSQVEEILMSHYAVGGSREGADAYPPLMLLKRLLLQKWYRIDSDPELENQMNDRISFKKFIGGCPSISIHPTIPPFPVSGGVCPRRR